jgi:hypothetical protein
LRIQDSGFRIQKSRSSVEAFMVFEKKIGYVLTRLGLKPEAIGAGSPLKRAQTTDSGLIIQSP